MNTTLVPYEVIEKAVGGDFITCHIAALQAVYRLFEQWRYSSERDTEF